MDYVNERILFFPKDLTGDRINMEDLSDEQIEGKTV